MGKLAELREKSFVDDPAEIDYGYCLPDCGRCCNSVNIDQGVVIDLRRAYGLEEEEFMKRGIGKNPRGMYMAQGENGLCVLLNDQKLCSVYEARPHTCTQFHGVMIRKGGGIPHVLCYADGAIEIDRRTGVNVAEILKLVWRAYKETEEYDSEIWFKRAQQVFKQSYEFYKEGIKEVLDPSFDDLENKSYEVAKELFDSDVFYWSTFDWSYSYLGHFTDLSFEDAAEGIFNMWREDGRCFSIDYISAKRDLDRFLAESGLESLNARFEELKPSLVEIKDKIEVNVAEFRPSLENYVLQTIQKTFPELNVDGSLM